MTLATVPLIPLTERINRRLGTTYKPQTISTARNGGTGHPLLIKAIGEETAAMLQEAADQAKAELSHPIIHHP